jgi:hypothetical protein
MVSGHCQNRWIVLVTRWRHEKEQVGAMPMVSCVFMLSAALMSLSACRTESAEPYTSQDLVGTWKCGPTPMYGPGFTITLLTTTIRREDGRFSSKLKAEVVEKGKEPVVNFDAIEGVWTLKGDVLTETIHSAAFISSTDPSATAEKAQARANVQLQKTRVYPNRVLKFERDQITTIPIGSEYKEAEVELVCKRA